MSFYILIHSFIVKTHLNDDFPWVLLQFLVLTSDTKNTAENYLFYRYYCKPTYYI